MNPSDTKCVIVIDQQLPPGVAANTSAILGITLGKQYPEAVGVDVHDKNGRCHLGIVEFPIPILKGEREDLRRLRESLYQPDFSDLTVIDFSDVAGRCHTYDEYDAQISACGGEDLNYYGLAICGKKKLVNKLTGSMPLFR